MIADFLKTVESTNTAAAYRRDLGKFFDWLGDDRLEDLTPADLLEFVAYLRDEDYAATSINRYLSAVRAFLRWAALVGRVSPMVFSAAKAVKGVKAPKKVPMPLTATEVEQLLVQPDLSTQSGARDYAFIQFALSTGVRLAEAVALNIEDVDFHQLQVVVDGKGSKERLVFFDDDAAAALIFYLRQRGNPTRGSLFANERGARISHRWLQRTLKQYGASAGVEVHPHKLRRTFAVDALNATGDLHSVAGQMGHANLNTTEIYASAAVERRRRVVGAAAEWRKSRVQADPALVSLPAQEVLVD